MFPKKIAKKSTQYFTILILFSIMNFLNQVDRRALVTLFPLFQQEWLLNDAQLGLAISLFTLARALTILPAGWLADRKGILRILRPTVFIWSALAAISGWAGSFAIFIFLRTGVGMMDGANNPLDLAYLGKMSPKAKLGLYLALYSTALYMGSGIGIIYAGAVGEKFGWRTALTLPGVLGLLLAIGFLILPKITNPQEKISAVGELRNLSWLVNARLSGIFLSGALGMFASTGLVSWLPTYLTRYYHLSLSRAGFLSGGLIVPASMIGALIGGKLCDNFFLHKTEMRYWISFLGFVSAMGFGMIALLTTDLIPTLAMLFLSALCFTLPVSPMLVLVQESVPAERLATTQAVFGLVSQILGAAPATGLVGILSIWIGLNWALMLPFIASGLGGLLIGFTGWKTREINKKL